MTFYSNKKGDCCRSVNSKPLADEKDALRWTASSAASQEMLGSSFIYSYLMREGVRLCLDAWVQEYKERRLEEAVEKLGKCCPLEFLWTTAKGQSARSKARLEVSRFCKAPEH